VRRESVKMNRKAKKKRLDDDKIQKYAKKVSTI